jgi:hypothetical protein
MRILATITLSASLMIAGPVLAGFEPMPAATATLNETVISKTAPDGTWPFALKDDEKQPVLYYSI